MKVIKKINNNVALAQDAKGREMLVFGKGIGFPAMPYELADLSVVQRTFSVRSMMLTKNTLICCGTSRRKFSWRRMTLPKTPARN